MPNQVKLKKQRGHVNLELLQDYVEEAIQSVPSAPTAVSSSAAYTSISGPRYIVQATDFFIACDPTNHLMRLTLPPAKNGTQTLIITDRTGQSGTHNVIVSVGLGIDSISGAAFYTLLTAFDTLRIRSDGVSRWMVW